MSDAMRGSPSSSVTSSERPGPEVRAAATPPAGAGAGAVLGFMGAGILAPVAATGELAPRAAFMVDGAAAHAFTTGARVPKMATSGAPSDRSTRSRGRNGMEGAAAPRTPDPSGIPSGIRAQPPSHLKSRGRARLRVLCDTALDRQATRLFEEFRGDEAPETFRRLFEVAGPALLPLVRMKVRRARAAIDPAELMTD